MKTRLIDVIDPETEVTLLLNSYNNKYNLAFKQDDGSLYITTKIVELSDTLLNVDLTKLTDDGIYTVGRVGTDNNGDQTNLFIDFSGQKIITEYTFKITNLERFKILKHLYLVD